MMPNLRCRHAKNLQHAAWERAGEYKQRFDECRVLRCRARLERIRPDAQHFDDRCPVAVPDGIVRRPVVEEDCADGMGGKRLDWYGERGIPEIFPLVLFMNAEQPSGRQAL
jgi:hypothetical protein